MAEHEFATEEERDLHAMRHSLAHVMATAVQQLFPHAKLGFGPPVENGFYYDFDFGDEGIEEADLKKIQKAMKKIVGRRQPFERTDTDREAALKLAEEIEEPYKTFQIENLTEKGFDSFSWYKNGDFMDLCEGPHVEHTGELPTAGLKLDRIAGAYWMGDEKNRMLTRIYALAFTSREELDDFLKRRKLAAERDHKKLGAELQLFHFDPLVGKGLPLWLPAGTVIRDEIEKYAKEMEFRYGYDRVCTPHIAKADLYHKSQHLPSYQESMFPPMQLKDEQGVTEEFYLKPMNCPHHHLIYDAHPRSYRDLPLRLAEYGTCYRFEQSGELSGLIRVRCMTMNDAHIYVRHDQIKSEFTDIMKMYQEFYATFGLTRYTYRLSIRGEENKDKFKGDAASWDQAERTLEEVLRELDIDFYVGEGEAAFYGPKLDIQFTNLMGREETVSTIQLDFLSPDNFDLLYVGDDGQEHRPAIFHRAPLSTHERFISFLIEYYAGAFPTWMAPVQICLIPVSQAHEEYAESIRQRLFDAGCRAEVDVSANSFNKKIRTNVKRKIPLLLILGDKELEAGAVCVRRYGIQEQETLPLDGFLETLRDEVAQRRLVRAPEEAI